MVIFSVSVQITKEADITLAKLIFIKRMKEHIAANHTELFLDYYL